MGNHEDWLLRTLRDHTRHSWLLGMEALDTIRSYSDEAAAIIQRAASEAGDAIYLERRAFRTRLSSMRCRRATARSSRSCNRSSRRPTAPARTAGWIPTTGGSPTRAPTRAHALIWGTHEFQARYAGERTLVYGHWNNAELDGASWPRPRAIGNTIGIDTICHGVLTAIRMPGRQIIQSARYS